jgi:predicted GH43/DUF377 family glycosyl hydrolase
VGTSVRIGICPVISSDAQLYLFPRLVAEGNFSRVGRARVLFDGDETPVAVERLGVVLEPDETWEANSTTAGVEDPRITFIAPVEEVSRDLRALARFTQHRPVALPEQPWEDLKIGAGTPPIRTAEGWLVVHHGVTGKLEPGVWQQQHVRYAAGAMLLDAEDVAKVLWRTATPLLQPDTAEERDGIVPNVVFPTAIDVRGDGDADVFYGMADSRIGVARLHRTG